jgi:hypothetical protein
MGHNMAESPKCPATFTGGLTVPDFKENVFNGFSPDTESQADGRTWP